ncbi:MAG: hypothetical protein NZM43_03675 [Saprospiraceae bacterium]|nr:hypothetical protein [Saprospiraceae bacterium]MDW8483404.1 hypothetical protein [Saprospiraceae bacterium]
MAIAPENARRQYRLATHLMRLLKLGVVMLFFYLVWNTVSIGLGRTDALSPALLWLVLGANGSLVACYLFRALQQ